MENDGNPWHRAWPVEGAQHRLQTPLLLLEDSLGWSHALMEAPCPPNIPWYPFRGDLRQARGRTHILLFCEPAVWACQRQDKGHVYFVELWSCVIIGDRILLPSILVCFFLGEEEYVPLRSVAKSILC